MSAISFHLNLDLKIPTNFAQAKMLKRILGMQCSNVGIETSSVNNICYCIIKLTVCRIRYVRTHVFLRSILFLRRYSTWNHKSYLKVIYCTNVDEY